MLTSFRGKTLQKNLKVIVILKATVTGRMYFMNALYYEYTNIEEMQTN